MVKTKISLFLIILLVNIHLYSDPLNLWSESAILIDYDTEQVLYEKNIDLVVAPASMTKLVTLYMTYLAIEREDVNKTDIVNISPRADWRNLPKDSSLMFIQQGQIVTLFDLMIGLAIPSGNDAAIAVAEHIYGNVENYLIEVNIEMKRLGFKTIQFVDSSGFHDNNQITTREFVEFCLLLIKRYPESLDELFTLEDYNYGGIRQINHNPLIGIYPNCDGLKTGFINKSGLNISLTATSNSRRVIAVLSGVRDEVKSKAELKRVYDSISILNFGLNNYENIELDKIILPNILVKNGTKIAIVQPFIPYKRIFTYQKNAKIEYDFFKVTAPIQRGEYLGNVIIYQEGFLYKFPVYSDLEI